MSVSKKTKNEQNVTIDENGKTTVNTTTVDQSNVVTEAVNEISTNLDKTQNDLSNIYKVMERSVSKGSKLFELSMNKRLTELTNYFDNAISVEEKTRSNIGEQIASTLIADIKSVTDTAGNMTRKDLLSIENKLENYTNIIDSISSDNNGDNSLEQERAILLKDLLTEVIDERKSLDLSIKKLAKERAIESTKSIAIRGFETFENNVISIMSESPLFGMGAKFLFNMFRGIGGFIKDVREQKKQLKQEKTNNLLEAQSAILDDQRKYAKELLQYQTDENIDNNENIESRKESKISPVDIQQSEVDIPIKTNKDIPVIVKGGIIKIDKIQDNDNLLQEFSSFNRRQEISSMDDTEQFLEKKEREEKSILLLENILNALKGKDSDKKSGFLNKFASFMQNLPVIFEGGIGGGIVLLTTKIKGVLKNIISPFIKIGKWIKELKITKILVKPFKLILSITKDLFNPLVNGLNFIKGTVSKTASVLIKLVTKPFNIIMDGLKLIIKPLGSILKLGKFAKLLGKFSGIGTIILTLYDAFKGFFNAGEVLGKIDISFMDRIGAAIGSVFESFGDIGDTILGWFGITTDMKGWINTNITRPLADILNFDFSGIWKSVQNTFTGIYEYISNIFSWETIQSGLSTIWKWSLLGIITNFGKNIFEFFSDKFSWETIQSGLSTIWKWSPLGILTEFGNKAKQWLIDKFSFWQSNNNNELIDRLDKKGLIDKGGILDRPELTNIKYMKENLSTNQLKQLKSSRKWNDDDLIQFDNMIKEKNKFKNISMEQMHPNRYNENLDKPFELNNLKNEILRKKNKELGDSISITNVNNNESSGSNEPLTVIGTSTPRDEDVFIRHMNQVFAP